MGAPLKSALVLGIAVNPTESDRLRKGGAEIRIGNAALANEPTGVNIEIHEIGEAFDTR
jgi:hypothetical protein